jgi:hypothetical protein
MTTSKLMVVTMMDSLRNRYNSTSNGDTVRSNTPYKRTDHGAISQYFSRNLYFKDSKSAIRAFNDLQEMASNSDSMEVSLSTFTYSESLDYEQTFVIRVYNHVYIQ